TADPLYMDVELSEDVPYEDAARALAAALAPGVRLTAGAYIEQRAPKLMALINYEQYRVTGPLTAAFTDAQLQDVLTRFDKATTIPYTKVTPKKTRQLDVRNIVPEPLRGRIEDDFVTITVGLWRTLAGSIKPTELWEILANDFALPVAAGQCLVSRVKVARRTEDGTYILPLDAAAQEKL
ncbi:MAG: DUF2344 domain-containing protein, partial [Negativicoccus succinicivorans]|nr:DUF2344 domain-containing protein [Negativicoccus succinicivorans]